MQNNLQLCYSAILNVESHCSLIVKQNINILLSFNCTSTVAQLSFNSSLSHRSLSSPLSLSLSFKFFFYSLSVLILSFNPSPSLVPLSVFGCGVEIGVKLWHGDRRWLQKDGKKVYGFCLGLILLGFVGHRRLSVFGSDFAGFLLVICGFCFGGDGWWAARQGWFVWVL